MKNRFLSGVPANKVERIFNSAAGNEIGSGKFDNPESSAALAANSFGFFLEEPSKLPPLPGCENEAWPAKAVNLETTVRFPWSGGRHPVLDCVVATPSALIGIESKRFEPFRSKSPSSLSEAYWRPVWGERMRGFERVRDALRDNPACYSRLDAAQLFKHAFALRTAAHRRREFLGLEPILYYLFAEPGIWPKTGEPVDSGSKSRHRQEIEQFAAAVAGDEVRFVARSYQQLLASWSRHAGSSIHAHAEAVAERFSP